MVSANEIEKKAQDKMTKSLNSFRSDLSKIRAGRANASLVSDVSVMYYGSPTPLAQVASISIPEPRVLMIKPFDLSSLEDIERAIYEADLGIAPNSDGEVIRLAVPQLTGESRKQIAKEVGKEAENGKVSIRQIRRAGMDALKKAQKDGDLTEDEGRSAEKKIQKLTDDNIKLVEKAAEEKEKEITEG